MFAASVAVNVVTDDEFQGCLSSVLLMTMGAVGSVVMVRDYMRTVVMRKRDWWTGQDYAVIVTSSYRLSSVEAGVNTTR